MKGYIVRYKSRESANHEIIDYWFSSSPNDAHKYLSREWADADVSRFNRGITINEERPRPHVLNNFQVEEFEDGFVVWCEGPFIIRTPGEAEADDISIETPDGRFSQHR